MSTAEPSKRSVALVTHDSQMSDLLDWVDFNEDMLAQCDVYASDPTCQALTQVLNINIMKFSEGLLKRGSKLSIDLLIFFWDFSEPLPDDVSTKIFFEMAIKDNIPIAANRSAAYYMFPCYLTAVDYEQNGLPWNDDLKRTSLPLENGHVRPRQTNGVASYVLSRK